MHFRHYLFTLALLPLLTLTLPIPVIGNSLAQQQPLGRPDSFSSDKSSDSTNSKWDKWVPSPGRTKTTLRCHERTYTLPAVLSPLAEAITRALRDHEDELFCSWGKSKTGKCSWNLWSRRHKGPAPAIGAAGEERIVFDSCLARYSTDPASSQDSLSGPATGAGDMAGGALVPTLYFPDLSPVHFGKVKDILSNVIARHFPDVRVVTEGMFAEDGRSGASVLALAKG